MKNIDFAPKIYKNSFSIRKFINKNPSLKVINAFDRQIIELFYIKNTKYVGIDEGKLRDLKIFTEFVNSKKTDYVYIYYSWNNHIVKCINKSDYLELKTNRNKNLITSKEQKTLRDYKIAVFGMSVGSNIAFVLTQTGISNTIIIADFDELNTTNLNRIWGGVHQVGLNKTIVAARRIYEDNPFAKVVVLDRGISSEKLELLLRKKEIDCIVEEIDQMDMKINIRKLSMKYKIPVLMVTDNGDWAVLHIERYDLGYKKIFNRNLNYWEKRMSTFSGKKDFADIVINQIVGGVEKVDPRMLDSAKKVMDRKLISWPQLGSAALLGAIAVTTAIKRIVRGEDGRLFTRTYLNPMVKDNKYGFK